MYKNYKFIKTSTAGNRTGFIIGEDAFRNRNFVMNIISGKINLEAEQYAFLWEEKGKLAMNMAGGELCGGAILASPILSGIINYKTEINTTGEKLKAEITTNDKNKIYTRTELPAYIIQTNRKRLFSKILNTEGYIVNLRDIAYFVTKEEIAKEKNLILFRKLDAEMQTQKSPCIGIIEIEKDGVLKPTVWVKKIGTIIEEQGCTTGTISAQLSFPQSDGIWTQPSGEIIRAKKCDDVIEIESCVELLSEGNIYLNGK